MKDARFAALAGADAIGLNFYEKSPRCIDLATAEEVLPVVPKTVAKVGVFVNAPPDEIERIANLLDLDYLQLHGDEPPEFLGNFVERKLIRGFRCGEEGFAPIAAYLDSCKSLGRIPDAVLLDAHRPGEYGGTGQLTDWDSVAQNRELFGDTPLVLAGGLTPFNAADAIKATRPDAVDVASGVESAPRTKDLLLLRAFCTAAKRAFSS